MPRGVRSCALKRVANHVTLTISGTSRISPKKIKLSARTVVSTDIADWNFNAKSECLSKETELVP